MTKHLVRWKRFPCEPKSFFGSLSAANEMDRYYGYTLLSRILAMKKQTPISLESAIQSLIDHEEGAHRAGRKGMEPGHMFWYGLNFVDWISSVGYHIELTGDDFEKTFGPQIAA